MKLSTLFEKIEILKTNANMYSEVEYITNDSRKVERGYAFVAINGTQRNGNDYILDALESGAALVVTDEADVCDDSFSYVLVEDVKSVLAKMWSAFYSYPDKGMKIIAITGTNGKTTSAYLLNAILTEAGISTGLISTVECLVNNEKIECGGGGAVSDICSAMTTPDPEVLYRLLYIMKEKGAKIVVMEASSHALDQSKLDGLDVEIGCFTNLSREHLDYHIDVESYFCAKKKLMLKSKCNIVNGDDEYGRRTLCDMKGHRTLSFSLEGSGDFVARNVYLDKNGCSFTLNFKEYALEIFTPLLGKYNVYNITLASSIAVLLGIENKHIINGIKKVKAVKGRLERYRDTEIYIDYAHTPEAFENVLKTVREVKSGRIIALFGCGGNRDKGKRREMGRICSNYADFSIITSDNPRNEDAYEIINDIVSGVEKGKSYCVIKDRKEAIQFLVKILSKSEVGLLLGKGHEEYEIGKEGKKHFSEREILDEVFLVDKRG